MATFKITANSTVKSFSKAFKEEFGATLQIYNGRLKADDSVKLVDIGVKTGTFECRSSRTVGSFVKMMQDDFNMKVKVRTADDWVTVIDGLTLNRINDLPKQTTKTVMEDYVSYQRKDTKSEDEKAETKVGKEEKEIAKVESKYPTYEECVAKYPASKLKNIYKLSDDGKVMSDISEEIRGALVVPEGVEIVDLGGSYRNNEITAVILPDSVKEMKGNFNGYICYNLKFIRLSPGIKLSKDAFGGCKLEDFQMPEGIKVIPNKAFKDCRLTELTLPNSLEFILCSAFERNDFEKLTIPSNVKVILPHAFRYCRNLKEVEIQNPETVILEGVFENCDNLSNDCLAKLYAAHALGEKSFGQDEVEYSEEKGNKVLSYVPEYLCGELRIEEGTVKQKDYSTISDAIGITKLYIPDSMAGNVPNLPDNVEEVRFPETVEGLSEYRRRLDLKGNKLTKFNYPKRLIKISMSYMPLTEITIPQGVEEVVINQMNELKKLSLPNSVKEFIIRDCKVIEEIPIPSTLKEIPSRFAENCESLKTVTIPGGVETIGTCAFASCSSLEKVVIPSSVTTIEAGAFNKCENLRDVVMEGEPTVHPDAFKDCPGYTVKKTGLATMEWDEDGLPLVRMNLVSVFVDTSYASIYEWLEEDGPSSNSAFIVTETNDLQRFPFNKIAYLEANDQSDSTKLGIFHSEYEDDCESALCDCYFLLQITDETYGWEDWENTERALSVLFSPKHNSLQDEEEYEGPEAIFEFAIYDENDYEYGSFKDDAEPFYTSRYRIFKNDENKWVGEKLED